MVMGWAALLLFTGSWVRALGGGGLDWTGLWVRGFVGRSRVRVGDSRERRAKGSRLVGYCRGRDARSADVPDR